MLLRLTQRAFNICFSSSKLASEFFRFFILTFGCLTLSRQEGSPLVPREQQDALSIPAAHFAKVPSAKGKKESVQQDLSHPFYHRLEPGASACSGAGSKPVQFVNQPQSGLLFHTRGWSKRHVVTPPCASLCVSPTEATGRLSASTSAAPGCVRLHRLPTGLLIRETLMWTAPVCIFTN